MSYTAQSAINQRPLAKESLRQSKTVEYQIPSRASVQDYQYRTLNHAIDPTKAPDYIPSRKAPAPPHLGYRPKTPTESLPRPGAGPGPTSPKVRNSLQKANPRTRKPSLTSTSTPAPSPRIVEQDPFAANTFDSPLIQHLKTQRSGPMTTGASPPPRPSRANTANLTDILPGSAPSQLFEDGQFYADPVEPMPPTPSEFNPALTSGLRSRSGTTSKSKKGVLGLMSGMFNPTKRPEISTPYDPVHLTHVGFNSSTGEFTGLPKEWQQLLQESGISRSEQEKNPQAVMEIVKFYQEGHGDVWDKLGNVGGNQELYQPKVEETFQNPVCLFHLFSKNSPLIRHSVRLHRLPVSRNKAVLVQITAMVPRHIGLHQRHLPRRHLLLIDQLPSVHLRRLPNPPTSDAPTRPENANANGDPRKRKHLLPAVSLRSLLQSHQLLICR